MFILMGVDWIWIGFIVNWLMTSIYNFYMFMNVDFGLLIIGGVFL